MGCSASKWCSACKCCCGCACTSAPTDINEVRRKDGDIEKEEMFKKAEEYIKGHYSKIRQMPSIGSRLQKYWMEIEEKSDKKEGEKKIYILSIAKFSTLCPLGNREEVAEKIETLNKLFSVINEHPNINEIKEVAVDRIEKIDADVVIVIQRKNSHGSLRDYLSESRKLSVSWTDKRVKRESSGDLHEVAKTYAIQILQGMLFLKKIGFPYLGNVQLGNIYVTGNPEDKEGICQISGHENALFGFRTKLFEKVIQNEGFLQSLDVILFGHVLYGLAKGKEMEEDTLFPSDEDIDRITEEKLRKILKYTFERSDEKMKHTLKNILNKLEEVKWYQRTPSRDYMQGIDESRITQEMKDLLKLIKP